MRLNPMKITLDGEEYVIGSLTIFDSLNLSRLTAPVLPILFNKVFANAIKALFASKKLKEASLEDVITEINAVVGLSEPLFVRIAQLPEEDYKRVINICLSCVERKQGEHWFKVWENGVPRFDDMDTATIFNLVIRVIVRELHPFIAALLKSAQEVA
ncbi:MAG TPA: hypothetical protein IAC66_07555 [Candidatus Aphodousia gallistercoris]|nr:hypothetical protein [Candidatus Aphodousia gallistercoris]